ncbi:MAG TPA: aquaporin [Candidatus Acidoferrales bacterium]|nr:aquaporin [Candidatus Acidoferrales bacterium]
MKKYIVELIGTFFLVLTVGCTSIGNGAGAMAPLAIGAVLMVMIYAGGYISGAHYNPAVTLGVWLRGKCDTKDVIPYWIAQFIGALAAAVVVNHCLKVGATVLPMTLPVAASLVSEFLFTFALVYVVLTTATAKGTEGNSFYGLAIGMTVMAGAYAVGNISGAVFNPGVALGVTMMGMAGWSSLWIYLVSEFIGGAAAAGVFRMVNPADN